MCHLMIGPTLRNGDFVVMRILVFIGQPRWNDILHTCSLCAEHVTVLNPIANVTLWLVFAYLKRKGSLKIQYKRWRKSCRHLPWMELASLEVIRTGDKNWLGRFRNALSTGKECQKGFYFFLAPLKWDPLQGGCTQGCFCTSRPDINPFWIFMVEKDFIHPLISALVVTISLPLQNRKCYNILGQGSLAAL